MNAQYFVQFSSLLELGDQLRSLYVEFCSRYQEAVSMYREMIKDDEGIVSRITVR
jgi:hypothetical protein